MEGFDEFDYSAKRSATFDRSFSFHSTTNELSKKSYPSSYSGRNESEKKFNNSTSKVEENTTRGLVKKLCNSFEAAAAARKSVSKSLWKNDSEESLVNDRDLNVVSGFRRALSSRQFSFNQSKTMRSMVSPLFDYGILFPGTEDRIVLFFTSLRGIRRTFEDCYTVRTIFKGFRVLVDERDISMDSSYRKELKSLLGEKSITLPHVFIGGKYIGGSDVIKQLHEIGELSKLLKGFPIRDPGFVCESCGDARFVPCLNCNGSGKVFDDFEGQLRRCLQCNENGLIRCPECCY